MIRVTCPDIRHPWVDFLAVGKRHQFDVLFEEERWHKCQTSLHAHQHSALPMRSLPGIPRDQALQLTVELIADLCGTARDSPVDFIRQFGRLGAQAAVLF